MAFGDEYSMNRSAYLALMAGDAYKKINDFQVPSISNQTITDLGDTSMVASTLATQGDFIGRQTLQGNQSSGTSTMADNAPYVSTNSNWWDKVTNFFNSIGNSINEGILDFADSIGDAAITIGSWFTPDDTWAENAIKTDWQAPVLKALDSYYAMSNPLNWINSAIKGQSASDYWNELWGGDWSPSGARQSLNEKKYDTFASNGAMDILTGIGNTVGQIAPSVAIAVATGGASVPVQAQMAIQGGLGAIQGLGSGTESAVTEGADMSKASAYGGIQGVIGGVTSGISAGIGATLSKGGQGTIGAASKKAGNWFLGKVGGKITDVSSRKTAEVLMGKTAEVLMDAGFDGFTTFIQSSLDPIFKQLTYDQNAWEKAYGSSDAMRNTFVQAVIAGGISAAASGIVTAAREGYTYLKDGKENYQNLYFDQKTLAYLNRSERKSLQEAINEYNNTIKPLQDTLDGLSSQSFKQGDDAGNAELTSLRYQTLDKLDKATRDYNEKYANTLNSALDRIHKVSNTGDSSNLEKAISYQNERVAKITGDIDNFRGFVKYYMDNQNNGKAPKLYGPDESAFTLNDGNQYPQIPSSSAPISSVSPTGGLPSLPSNGGEALAMPRLTYKSTLVSGRSVDLAIGTSALDNKTPVLKPQSNAAVLESLNFVETHKNSIAPKQVEFNAKAIDPSLEGTIIAKPIDNKDTKNEIHDTAIDLQSTSANGEEKAWRGKLFPADDWQGQYYFSVNSDDVLYIDKYRSRRTATMEEVKAKSRLFNEFLKEQKVKSLSKTSPQEIAKPQSADKSTISQNEVEGNEALKELESRSEIKEDKVYFNSPLFKKFPYKEKVKELRKFLDSKYKGRKTKIKIGNDTVIITNTAIKKLSKYSSDDSLYGKFSIEKIAKVAKLIRTSHSTKGNGKKDNTKYLYYQSNVVIDGVDKKLFITVRSVGKENFLYDIQNSLSKKSLLKPVGKPSGYITEDGSSMNMLPLTEDKNNTGSGNGGGKPPLPPAPPLPPNGNDGDGKKENVEIAKSKIEIGMSDEDRSKILEGKIIAPVKITVDKNTNLDFLKRINTGNKAKILKEFQKAGIKDYSDGVLFQNIGDLGEGAFLSNSGLRESISKTANYNDQFWVFQNIDEILKQAVVIERHYPKEGKKKNGHLDKVTEMISAVEVDGRILPIKITIKHFDESEKKRNKIYVLASRLEMQKAGDPRSDETLRAFGQPASVFNIPQFLEETKDPLFTDYSLHQNNSKKTNKKETVISNKKEDSTDKKNIKKFKADNGDTYSILRGKEEIQVKKKGSSEWEIIKNPNLEEFAKNSKGLAKLVNQSKAKTIADIFNYADKIRNSKPKKGKEVETWPNKKSKISVESTKEQRKRILEGVESIPLAVSTNENEIKEISSIGKKKNANLANSIFKKLNKGDFFKAQDNKYLLMDIPDLGIKGQFTSNSIRESIDKSEDYVNEFYALKNAEELLKTATLVEIHNDNKTEKNEGVLSVAVMISFMSIGDGIVPIKIVVKSYGKTAETPYKIYVFSAREQMKRDLVLRHRRTAGVVTFPKSLLRINILDFFKLSRDFELLKYSPLELNKEQQGIVGKEKRGLAAKEGKAVEPVEGNIGFGGGSQGGNGNGGGKPPLPPAPPLPPNGNDGNDGGDKKPKKLPKPESQEINPYIEGRARKDSNSDDKSSARLIEDSANARKEKVYSLSDVRKALDTLTKEVGKIGEKNNFTEKDVKELFIALNIKDVETQDKAVSDFIDRISERTYDVDGTEVSHIFDDDEKAELKQRLTELLKSSGKPSELRKALDAFKDTVSRMNKTISRWKLKADTRIDYAKALSKLKNNEVKLKRGQTPAGQVVVGPLAMFDNAYKAMKLSKADYGISENTFRGVSDALKGYKEEIFLDDPTLPYMYNSELRADVDTIDRYLNMLDSQNVTKADKADALQDASKALVDLIGRINHEISDAQEKYVSEIHYINKVMNEENNLADFTTKGKWVGNIVAKAWNNSMSVGEVFATVYGNDSEIVKFFTTDAYDALSSKKLMEIDLENKFLSKKAIGSKPEIMKKKMKTKIDGNVIDVGTAALIYASSLSPSNKEEMLKFHIKLKDLKGGQTRTADLTQKDLDNIIAELPDNVKKWAEMLYTDLYNGEGRKIYKEKYLEFTGVEPDMEQDYFPRRRGDLTQKGIDASNTNWSPKYMNGLDQPFNKPRTNSHNPLDFTDDLYTFTDNYINELSVFAKLTPFMKKFDSLNIKFGTKSVLSRISELVPDGGKMVDYWIKRFMGIATSKGDNIFTDFMAKGITSIFALNIMSSAKQVISSLKIPLVTGVKAYVYGLVHGLKYFFTPRKVEDDITSRSGIMASRLHDNEVLKANTLVNNVGKIGKALGFLMSWVDKKVITTTAWSAAEYHAQELGFGKIGTKENKDKAAKILDEIVIKTQSNSESIDVSRIRGGDLGTFSKMVFGTFAADNQKTLEWLNDATRKDYYTAERLKHYDDLFDHFDEKIKEQDDVLNDPESSDRERQEAQDKKQNYEDMKDTFRKRQEADKESVSPKRRAKRISFVLAVLLLSAGMSAGITALVNKYLKGKEVKGQDVVMDFASESVSWIPYLGTIVNAILNKQDSLNAASLSSLNNLLSLAQQLYTTGSKGTWDADKMKLVYKGLSAFGSLTGLPFKNLLDYSSGITKTVGGTWGDMFYNWVHGYDSSVIVARAKSEYESGDLTSSTKSISTLMSLYKSGSVDWDTSREIARLYGEKLSVMPKNYMTEYKDENGDTKTLIGTQLASFQKEYSKANKIAEKIVKTSEYKSLDDEGKARTLKKLFDSYYDSAKAKALGIQASSKLGQVLSLSGGNIDLANIILLMQQLSSLTTDQRSTRKDKAVKVVNSATEMDKGERLLSLWLDGFGLDDQSTNYLRRYLVGLGADSRLVSQTID